MSKLSESDSFPPRPKGSNEPCWIFPEKISGRDKESFQPREAPTCTSKCRRDHWSFTASDLFQIHETKHPPLGYWHGPTMLQERQRWQDRGWLHQTSLPHLPEPAPAQGSPPNAFPFAHLSSGLLVFKHGRPQSYKHQRLILVPEQSWRLRYEYRYSQDKMLSLLREIFRQQETKCSVKH